MSRGISSTAVFDTTRWTGEDLDALADGVGGSVNPAVAEEITVTAPAVDEPIGTIPALPASAVGDVIDRCRTAAASWAERSPAERARVLDRFAELVEENWKLLLDLDQLETGKARKNAFEEINDPIVSADYYAERAPGLLSGGQRRPLLPLVTTAEVAYEPVGVVGVIAPWNYPIALSFTDAIPALAAGNGVVIKPDERTPFTALLLAELFREAGLPEDVCTIVTGEPREVGEALVGRVDHVTFTGSTETGRSVAEQAGRNLTDCSLELGGKNPMLVCEDADLESAARGATRACFANAGQICLGMERLYVEKPRYEAFLDRFVAATEELSLGASYDFGPDVGSLIGADQLERVTAHVEDARSQGATVECGGRERADIGPFFYEPTILTDVPDGALPSCEETFGPVVTVEPVASVEEGIDAANDSPYGLNASVWTGDRSRGIEIARRIECGTVCVNDGYAVGYGAIDAPMGGLEDSGMGRRHGTEGLKRYVEPKTIASSKIGPMGSSPFIPDSIFARAWMGFTRTLRRVRKWGRSP